MQETDKEILNELRLLRMDIRTYCMDLLKIMNKIHVIIEPTKTKNNEIKGVDTA